MKAALTRDQVGLSDPFAARRYFAKFARITGHLRDVADEMQAGGWFDEVAHTVISAYLEALGRSFEALSMKYLLTGKGSRAGALRIDVEESGFPVFAELLRMANDAQQAHRHLLGMRSARELKDEMLRVILNDHEVPVRLQYALSQRLYYEMLERGGMFWAQNDPVAVWDEEQANDRRRTYLVHWAVYDSQVNLPSIYLMELEDTGRRPLPRDQGRWPEVQAHLMAQSVAGLKLVTIARGFDADFDDLHPKFLRRVHVGPMYSHAFTRQLGPIREVLESAAAPMGEDWALAWTLEDLESADVKEERKGWFSTVEREIFALDPFSGMGVDTGATRTSRALILPERPFQALAELDPPGFADVRKYVVGPSGQVLEYR